MNRMISFLIAILLFACNQSPKKSKVIIDQESVIIQDSITTESVTNIITKNKSIRISDDVLEMIDTSIIRNIRDSIIQFIELQQKKNQEYHFEFFIPQNITSIEKYIACNKWVYLYNNPWDLKDEYDQQSNNPSDSVSIFDTLLVPQIDNDSYKVILSSEVYLRYMTLCIKDSKLLYFFQNQCVNLNEKKNFNDTLFIYNANTDVITNKQNTKYKKIPSNYYTSSKSKSFIIYDSLTSMYLINAKSFIKYLDIQTWNDCVLDSGSRATITEDESLILYFQQESSSFFMDRVIKLVDLKSKTNNFILSIPDSLITFDPTIDGHEPSLIKKSVYNSQKCYSVDLWLDRDRIDRPYILYFNLNGDILKIKRRHY